MRYVNPDNTILSIRKIKKIIDNNPHRKSYDNIEVFADSDNVHIKKYFEDFNMYAIITETDGFKFVTVMREKPSILKRIYLYVKYIS